MSRSSRDIGNQLIGPFAVSRCTTRQRSRTGKIMTTLVVLPVGGVEFLCVGLACSPHVLPTAATGGVSIHTRILYGKVALGVAGYYSVISQRSRKNTSVNAKNRQIFLIFTYFTFSDLNYRHTRCINRKFYFLTPLFYINRQLKKLVSFSIVLVTVEEFF